jgi:hypothetical protein
MKHAHLMVASAMLAGLAGAARADDIASARPVVEYEVQIVSNGALVGTVPLPRDAVTTVSADFSSGSAITQTHTYTGHVVLTARVDGREIVTLQGDQMTMTARPH